MEAVDPESVPTELWGKWTDQEIAELHQRLAESRKRYDQDPILFLLKEAIDDLKEPGLECQNIKLYQVTGPLPTQLTVVPNWLTPDNLANRLSQDFFLYEGESYDHAFCTIVDTYYLYLDFIGSSSGYDCCQKLTIYFADSWLLLLPHIQPTHLPIKLKLT